MAKKFKIKELPFSYQEELVILLYTADRLSIAEIANKYWITQADLSRINSGEIIPEVWSEIKRPIRLTKAQEEKKRKYNEYFKLHQRKRRAALKNNEDENF